MNKVINFGSLNVDYVYRVEHIVRPGETIPTRNFSRFCGGKGLNQSIALARAGAAALHAGLIGTDGAFLKNALEEAGVDVSLIRTMDGPSGHALIQVDDGGENSIIIHGGANCGFTEEYVIEVLALAEPGDFVLVQNEVNLIPFILEQAAQKGLRIFFNPSPMEESVLSLPLERVGCFIVNEKEAETITGRSEEEALDRMTRMYPGSETVLTLGSRGMLWSDGRSRLRVPAFAVQAVDTTAAGDTFLGYFLAERLRGTSDPETCLRIGAKAASLCVQKPGAADSIPLLADVTASMSAG